MATYYVQQKSTTWYELSIDADTYQDALEIGKRLLETHGGHESEGTFEWEDSFAVLDDGGKLIYLNEDGTETKFEGAKK